MKLKDFLKQFEGLNPETEIVLPEAAKNCVTKIFTISKFFVNERDNYPTCAYGSDKEEKSDYIMLKIDY